MLPPHIYTGSTTAHTINTYFIRAAPVLRARGIRAVVLDNAAVHIRGLLVPILAAYGISILFLPPYHPARTKLHCCFPPLPFFAPTHLCCCRAPV